MIRLERNLRADGYFYELCAALAERDTEFNVEILDCDDADIVTNNSKRFSFDTWEEGEFLFSVIYRFLIHLSPENNIVKLPISQIHIEDDTLGKFHVLHKDGVCGLIYTLNEGSQHYMTFDTDINIDILYMLGRLEIVHLDESKRQLHLRYEL